MATAQDMIDRIADELDDADLSSGGQILKAINSAVMEYRDRRFWFNTVVGKSFAVAAADEYLAPSITVTGISTTEPITVIDLLKIDDGTGANYAPITMADNALIDARQTGSVTGRPRYASLVADSDGTRLRFYPIADTAYTAVLSGLIRFSDLAAATSNPWTNDAEILIRQAAKRILMTDVTKELPAGSGPTMAEMKALSDLYATTRLRRGSAPARADELVAMQGGGGRGDIATDTAR
jgi:hypothetical protein